MNDVKGTDEITRAHMAGMELGVWIERDARPLLTRWCASTERRVRLTACVLDTLLDTALAEGNWNLLGQIRDSWVTQAEKISADKGDAVEASADAGKTATKAGK